MPSFKQSVFVAAAALAAAVIAAPVAASTYTAPYAANKFQLEILPNSFTGYEGMWVTTFHTGAGTAITTLTYNQSEALTWHFHKKTGDIYTNIVNEGNPLAMSINLTHSAPYATNVLNGYYAVTADLGYANSGFNFTIPQNKAFPSNGSFAACPVTSPYPGVVNQIQLLWRPTTTVINDVCNDMTLKAIGPI